MGGGFGNTTPDPFNPHAYGAAPGMHAHHGQMHFQGGAPYAPSMMDASQPRMTPMPGDVHGTRRSQDAYYPGAAGAGAPQHPPRFG
jgi:hypothetical protein